MLLNAELAGLLPHLVLEREEDNLGTSDGLNALESSSLVFWGWASNTVAFTSGGPSAFHDVALLAGADALEDPDLGSDQVTGLRGSGLGVEESIQVGGRDVDDVAKSRALRLPDRELLSGGD